MKKINQRWTIAAGCLLAAGMAMAGMDHQHMPAQAGSPGLERMKQLVGAWEGPNPMDPKGGSMTVVYELTAAGSAVAERFMEGTPGEMLTVYYDQDGKTTMTHYCSMGNRPTMALKSMDKDKMSFEMVDGSVSPKEAHMHALTLTFPDANHLEADWSMRDPAKGDQSHPMKFARKR